MYPIKDPKKEKQHQRGEWNARCENLLSSILETYRPQMPFLTDLFRTEVVNIGILSKHRLGLDLKVYRRRAEITAPISLIVKFCLEE